MEQIDGCYECNELANCTKGFYQPDNNGAYACKAQEILGRSVKEGLKILEENIDK